MVEYRVAWLEQSGDGLRRVENTAAADAYHDVGVRTAQAAYGIIDQLWGGLPGDLDGGPQKSLGFERRVQRLAVRRQWK